MCSRPLPALSSGAPVVCGALTRPPPPDPRPRGANKAGGGAGAYLGLQAEDEQVHEPGGGGGQKAGERCEPGGCGEERREGWGQAEGGLRYSHVAEERGAGVHRGALRGRQPGARRWGGGGGARRCSAPRLLSPCLAPRKGGHKRLQKGKGPRRPARPAPGGARPAAPRRGEPPAPLRSAAGPGGGGGGEPGGRPRRGGRAGGPPAAAARGWRHYGLGRRRDAVPAPCLSFPICKTRLKGPRCGLGPSPLAGRARH